MFDSKYSKLLTVILVIVIVAIVGLLGFLVFDLVKSGNDSKQASQFVENFENSANENATEKNDTETNDVMPDLNAINIVGGTTSTQQVSNTSGKKKYKGYTVQGTIKIPKISLELPIFEEMGAKSLEIGAQIWYPRTGDDLNSPGNTVIAGHNYRNGKLFSNLKKLNIGDKVYITNYKGQTMVYTIYNKFEASSTDTSFYSRDTGGLAEITLQTCTDSSTDQRTIIFAKQST